MPLLAAPMLAGRAETGQKRGLSVVRATTALDMDLHVLLIIRNRAHERVGTSAPPHRTAQNARRRLSDRSGRNGDGLAEP
mmetsp:Transcript_3002/g.12142  ORF Transcript_3002/g.12142 Transcript_3002/m.12142 type:complete len:80 (-) Transcript_3002:35-274(-)